MIEVVDYVYDDWLNRCASPSFDRFLKLYNHDLLLEYLSIDKIISI